MTRGKVSAVQKFNISTCGLEIIRSEIEKIEKVFIVNT